MYQQKSVMKRRCSHIRRGAGNRVIWIGPWMPNMEWNDPYEDEMVGPIQEVVCVIWQRPLWF